MTRGDFLRELRYRISYLPKEEQDAAMAYYMEYFEEAGDDAAVLLELGSPAEVAARIIADYNSRNNSMPVQQKQPQERKGCLPGFLVGVLATVSSPVWLPLIAVAAILFLVLIFVVFILLFVLGVVAVSLFGAALKVIFISIPTAIFGIGTALLLFGLLILAACGVVSGVKAVINNMFHRKGA
ncbi:MAG: DUF1700 domain-containing protein [Oscillospiraceae bacterium]|nr:DUF1700 domain-containing protein [Oscillospiraceae bacterium]